MVAAAKNVLQFYQRGENNYLASLSLFRSKFLDFLKEKSGCKFLSLSYCCLLISKSSVEIPSICNSALAIFS